MLNHGRWSLWVLLASCIHQHASGSYAPTIEQCPALRPRAEKPRSIEDLRADDIKVIMALGDSVTAAVTATSSSVADRLLYLEHRGSSFSIGGDPNQATIANFVKRYASQLVGPSLGSHPLKFCMHDRQSCPPKELLYRPQQDAFNAALSGATSVTLELELEYLSEQISQNAALSLSEDWKMLTLFVGVNEVCHTSCKGTNEQGIAHTATTYEENVSRALTEIQAKIPRTLVNIILLPDLSQLEAFINIPRCIQTKPILPISCPCAMIYGEAGRQALRRVTSEYNDRLVSLAQRVNDSVRAEAEKTGQPAEFAVTISPVFRETHMQADIPAKLLSNLDCFHPSLEAHQSLAMSIWRDLYVPYSHRATHLHEQSAVFCPSESDRLQIG